jgi:hypothetical protein
MRRRAEGSHSNENKRTCADEERGVGGKTPEWSHGEERENEEREREQEMETRIAEGGSADERTKAGAETDSQVWAAVAERKKGNREGERTVATAKSDIGHSDENQKPAVGTEQTTESGTDEKSQKNEDGETETVARKFVEPTTQSESKRGSVAAQPGADSKMAAVCSAASVAKS